jgi:hypothetical protein
VKLAGQHRKGDVDDRTVQNSHGEGDGDGQEGPEPLGIGQAVCEACGSHIPWGSRVHDERLEIVSSDEVIAHG